MNLFKSECGICGDDGKRLSRSNCVLIAGVDKVCVDCFQESIIPEFKASIEDGRKFPYHWGETPLRFQDFKKYIPDEDWEQLITAFDAKRTELDTPLAERQYCRNDGTYTGRKGRINRRGDTVWEKCATCEKLVCSGCGRSNAHTVCRRNSVEDAYADSQRGKDYQLCPACDNLDEQSEGCNTMACSACKTEYCFICGQPATHRSDHWQPGKSCPRFNQPGATNAVFDDEVEFFDGFIPDDEDFRLQTVARTARELLHILRDESWWARSLHRVGDAASRAVMADFRLAIENMSINYGWLDFNERPNLDVERSRERNQQIEAFTARPESGVLIRLFRGLEDVWKDYRALRFPPGDERWEGRPFIDQEVRAGL